MFEGRTCDDSADEHRIWLSNASVVLGGPTRIDGLTLGFGGHCVGFGGFVLDDGGSRDMGS